jgi:chemotaxis protein histidine kinase CheA
MLVELETLKANPERDFIVDPIDPDIVEKLKDSIEDHGFWGGVICRQLPTGMIEIAAGHHRVQAALAAGVTQAELLVRDDIDDLDMVRIYTRENGTQRGFTNTALAGSVASALRLLTKIVLTGNGHKFMTIFPSPNKTRNDVESGEGIGQKIIFDFLQGRSRARKSKSKTTHHVSHVDAMPYLKQAMIQHQLVNLKTSGNYTRIVQEVKDEIAAEEAEALAVAKALEEEAERLRHEQEAEAEQKRLAEEEERAARQRKLEAEEEERAAHKRAQAAQVAEEKARREAEAKDAEAKREAQAALEALAKKRQQEAEKKEREFAKQRADAEARSKAAETATAQKKAASSSAKKAVARAEKETKTFDLEGVQRYLKNDHQVDVFRKFVTSAGIQPLLAVEDQAALAKHLLERATAGGYEFSGRFIQENISDLVMHGKAAAREETKEDTRKLIEADLRYKERQYQLDLIKALGSVATHGRKLETLYGADWPADMERNMLPDLPQAMHAAKTMLDKALRLL